ncbi:MAG: tetratricopeptide repeat protein [Planctomycetes bacterium]|nr:tetratricopeptide repeat protein [Planctomycetota bacterium]
MTKVIMSGSARVAVRIDADSVRLWKYGANKEPQTLPHRYLRLLFSPTDDLTPLDTDNNEAVTRGLTERVDLADGLMLYVSILDPNLSLGCKKGAARELNEILLSSSAAIRFSDLVTSALIPARYLADIPEFEGVSKVSSLIATIKGQAPALHTVYGALDGAALAANAQELGEGTKRLVAASGIPGRMAQKMVAGELDKLGIERMEAMRLLKGTPNFRDLVVEWFKAVGARALDIPSMQELIEGERDTQAGDSEAKGTKGTDTYDRRTIFDRVGKQKADITPLLRLGKRERAIRYTQQLIDMQMKYGGGEYAAKTLCDLSQRAKELGNLHMQISLAEWATRVAPTDGWSYCQLADGFIGLGKFDDAKKSLEHARIWGQAAYATSGLARILMAHERYQAALDLLDHERQSIADTFVWNQWAECHRRLNRIDDALNAYGEVAERFPEDRVARCGLASTLVDAGRIDEAISMYYLILEQVGSDPIASNGLAHAHHLQGDDESALTLYSRTAREHPEDFISISSHAHLLRILHRFSEATARYRWAHAQYPLVVTFLEGLADVAKAELLFDSSLRYLEQAISMDPRRPNAYVSRIDVFRRMGQKRAALNAADKLIAEFPKNFTAMMARASLFKELGELAIAVDSYKRVVDEFPESTEAGFAARALAQLTGNKKEVERLKGYEGNPRSQWDWLALHLDALRLLRIGRWKPGESQLRLGSEKSPFQHIRSVFRRSLSGFLVSKGRYGEALDALEFDTSDIGALIRLHAFIALDDTANVVTSKNRTAHVPDRMTKLRSLLLSGHAGPGKRDSSEWSEVVDEEIRQLGLGTF